MTARAEVFFAQSCVSSPTSPDQKPANNVTHRQAATPAAAPPSPPTALPTPPPAPASSAPGNPPYPLSFAALASLIASGAPIPGIRDIPDKLAEGEPSVSTVDVAAVRKPWEVEKEDVVLGSDGITGDGSGKMIEGE